MQDALRKVTSEHAAGGALHGTTRGDVEPLYNLFFDGVSLRRCQE